MRFMMIAVAAAALSLGACSPTTSETSNQQAVTESDRLSAGIEAFKAGDYAAAEAAFQQVLESDPRDPYANLNMGVLKAVQGDKAAALAFYRAAAENGENSPIVEVRNASGQSVSGDTTVAAVARGNIERLDL